MDPEYPPYPCPPQTQDLQYRRAGNVGKIRGSAGTSPQSAPVRFVFYIVFGITGVMGTGIKSHTTQPDTYKVAIVMDYHHHLIQSTNSIAMAILIIPAFRSLGLASSDVVMSNACWIRRIQTQTQTHPFSLEATLPVYNLKRLADSPSHPMTGIPILRNKVLIGGKKHT